MKSLLLLGLAGMLMITWTIIHQHNQPTETKPSEDHALKEANEPSALPTPHSIETLKGLREGIESHRQTRELEAEAEENERQRLAKWKANFPYKKTYHPTLTYDPNRYNPNDPLTFRGDPEMEMGVKNHGFLVAFYNNPQIYSAEFEQLYHMLKEIDRADNTKITGEIFNALIHYHKVQHFYDPKDLWAKKGSSFGKSVGTKKKESRSMGTY